MLNSPLLSIIIPVYNTEKFIDECCNSILKQTYKNLEIIFVDDASPDGAYDKIREYINHDDRVKCIRHSTNLGLFQARLSGVSSATGKYLLFIDSDDYISIDFCRTMVLKAETTSSDIVLTDWVFAYPDNRYEYYNLDPVRNQSFILKDEEVIQTFLEQRGLSFSWHFWNKLYRRDLWMYCLPHFEQLSKEHENLVMTEDLAFNCVLWIYAKIVSNVHDVLYFYRKHEGQETNSSMSSEKFSKKVEDMTAVFDFFESILKLNGYYDKYKSDFIAWKKLYGRMYHQSAKNEGIRLHKQVKKQLAKFNSSEFSLQNDDNYFYQCTSDLGKSFWNMEHMIEAITNDQTKYVSFDLFDTLVTRPFYRPGDLFSLMDTLYMKETGIHAYVNFSRLRMEAEKNARQDLHLSFPGYEDLTLDEIYDRMKKDYFLQESTADLLKDMEKDLEYQFCKTRNMGMRMFQLAKEQNKKILITSDMYLPIESIQEILERNNYNGYEKIFVSSAERLTKSTGNLFRYIIKKLSIQNKAQLIHIGDNWVSDVLMPRRLKIPSFHMPKALEVYQNYNAEEDFYKGDSFWEIFRRDRMGKDMKNTLDSFLGLRTMVAVVANKIFDNPFQEINKVSDFNSSPYFIGYYALGMYLYSVANWIYENAKKDKKKKIHFIARDGYLLKKAYDILTKEDTDAPESNYLYLSRKALLPLDIVKKEDLFSIFDKINVTNLSIRQISSYLIMDNTKLVKFIAECKTYGFSADKKIESNYEFTEFLKILVAHFDDLELGNNNAKIKKYLQKLISPDDVIVDVGYSGRIESILSNVLNCSIDAYYIHSNSDLLNRRENTCGFHTKLFYEYKPIVTGLLREHLFMEQGPSTERFEINGENVFPVFSEYNSNYQVETITKIIQEASLDFVNDMSVLFKNHMEYMHYRKDDAAHPFEYYLNYSKNFDRQLFSTLIFEDELALGEEVPVLDYWNGVTNRICDSSVNGNSADDMNLYQDGVLVQFIHLINKLLSLGSKRRACLRKCCNLIGKVKNKKD